MKKTRINRRRDVVEVLPSKIEPLSKTPMGRLWQYMRCMLGLAYPRRHESLLTLFSKLKQGGLYPKHELEKNILPQEGRIKIKEQHIIVSEEEEEYSLYLYRGKERLDLLRLKLSLCNGELNALTSYLSCYELLMPTTCSRRYMVLGWT